MLTAAASEAAKAPPSGAADHRIWDATAETMPRERLAALQLERLRETVARVLNGQPLGAASLAEAGVESTADIGSLDDLANITYAHKSDLREHYPFGLLAVPREQVVRV